MRFAVGFFAALLVGGSALANVPAAKSLPADLTHEELQLWAEAQMHERRGDLSAAVGKYRLLLERTRPAEKKPLSAAVFNLARVFLRGDDAESAADQFEKYVTEQPTAPDVAQIKKLIEQLRKQPRWTYVGTHDQTDQEADATLIIDGELAGKSPGRLPADNRKDHVIARIGKTSLVVNGLDPRSRTGYESIGTGRGHSASSTDKGNVWLDFYSKSVYDLELGGQRAQVNKLITLRPGKYTTTFGSKDASNSLCAPITFEVKPGVLNFVSIIATSGQHGHYGCWDVEKLRTHYLPWSSL